VTEIVASVEIVSEIVVELAVVVVVAVIIIFYSPLREHLLVVLLAEFFVHFADYIFVHLV